MMNKTAIQGIIIIGVLFIGIGLPLDAFADVLPPKKQMNFGIDKTEIFCKATFFKVIKASNEMPVCVNPDKVKRLVELGWALPVDTKLLEKFVQQVNSRESIGTMTIQSVLKQNLPPKIATLNPATSHYLVLFQVCANDKDIRLPEVILSSETATRYVKLSQKITANTCEINSGKIQAANKDTIKAELVNKGGVTKKITELENKVKEINEQLKVEKSQLSSRINQAADPSEFKPDEKRISNISELRKDLNSAKDELNKYQFALNVIPKIKTTDLKIQKTSTGVTVEGVSVMLISANPQLLGKGYDVTFEMCAANETVRVPIVLVSSDTESKSIKLADRIIPKTCQISGAKIKADSVDSIEVSIANTADRSMVVITLEKKISQLVDELETQKRELNELTHQAPKPADFRDQVENIAENIIDLRGQILLEKAKLYNLLNLIYD